MAADRNPTSNSIGFCLLPSELLEDIFLRLAVPEILRLESVSRALASFISDDDFRRVYGCRSASDTWVFLYKKGSSRRHSALLGFSERSGRWFRIPVAGAFLPLVLPGEDLYFLAASGDIFLFASNYRRELVAVDLAANHVKRIPPGPLGPRGTSSWRRSGLKLVASPAGSGEFHFLFAELVEGRPYLFSYSSETDTWLTEEAQESHTGIRRGKIVLSVAHRQGESIILSTQEGSRPPIVLRSRFSGWVAGVAEEAVGLVADGGMDRLHVYGDGQVAVVRSEKGTCGRIVTCVEVWTIGKAGRNWELITRLPEGVVAEMGKRPFGAMIGCLEERCGALRLVLLSNYKGAWDLVLLCYHLEIGCWTWAPLPNCGAQGLNMAGIALSSGPTLRT